MIISNEQLINCMKEAEILVDYDSFDSKLTFAEQGVDSLDLSSLFFIIEEKYGVKITDEDIESLISVDQLINYLANKEK